MRKSLLVMLGATVVAFAAVLVAALTTSSTVAFSIGVLSTSPSSPINGGQTACQRPIRVPPGGAFDRVDLEVGTYHKRGPALDVTVRPVEGAGPVRRGFLPAGYPDVGIQQRQVVHVGEVPDDALIAVCVHNRGPGPIALFGNSDASTRQSAGYIQDHPISFDFDLVFRREARSFVSLLPDMADRASLFRPPWVSPGLFYALLAVIVFGLPFLLARALRSAAERQ